MLEQLKLSNLALSNQAEVDFTPGMICITGETGAGKSLVVDALSLVLGAKADSNLVRQGQKQMEVSALFSIDHNKQAHKLLEAYGFVEEKPKSSLKTTSTASTSVASSTSGSLSCPALLTTTSSSNKCKPVNISCSNSAQDVLDNKLLAQNAVVADGIVVGIPLETVQSTALDATSSFSFSSSSLKTSSLSPVVVDQALVSGGLATVNCASNASGDSALTSGFTTANTGSTIITSTRDISLRVEGTSEIDLLSDASSSAVKKDLIGDSSASPAPDALCTLNTVANTSETLVGASAESFVNTKENNALENSKTTNHLVPPSKSAQSSYLSEQESDSSQVSAMPDMLEEGFDDDDNELIIRRVVSAEGKSKAYINGHMATLSQLREISECLVAIHGQHASVRLMNEKYQLEIVDNFGKLKPLVSKVNQAFAKYSSSRQNLTKLSEEQKLGAQAYKQDRHELEELKRLDLKEGDYEELEAAFDKAMHQAQFLYAVTNLYNLIEGNESSIVDLLRDRLSDLDKVKAYDPHISQLMEAIDTSIMNLYECSAQAEDLMNQDMELSSAELEAKMSKVHELSRRFACAPKDLYLMSESLEQKVEQFLSLKDKINALTQEVKDLRQNYEDLCQELTLKRKETALHLAQQICERVKSLALPDARFDIVLTRDDTSRPRLNGRDDLCFMFSANLGQELRPLSAVASGGELSRLALIIEVLTASVKSTPTLIFDEVDTGISGRTASAVGSLLKELGQYVQVITVTHLPQVAAKAHTQFVVAKFNENGQVNSTISLLDKEGRVEEISRMIGGSVITETTRKSAYELLNDL